MFCRHWTDFVKKRVLIATVGILEFLPQNIQISGQDPNCDSLKALIKVLHWSRVMNLQIPAIAHNLFALIWYIILQNVDFFVNDYS